jgi:hypothetical protein
MAKRNITRGGGMSLRFRVIVLDTAWTERRAGDVDTRAPHESASRAENAIRQPWRGLTGKSASLNGCCKNQAENRGVGERGRQEQGLLMAGVGLCFRTPPLLSEGLKECRD